ncbi:GGDEF domain-containing protein [Deinococcus multiflagellatus]|uniref:GGDEF domain-containing protein n=1 Tax=Deinococcus multiflagellatus TaxID=1656887 RepID=A0ABW1ZMH8_9DEIO
MTELRLRHLDAQRSIERLSRRLSSMATAATTDALTGLPNRWALDTELSHLDATAEEFAVVFIDLDGFKAINDEHGHAMGDSLLKGYGLWLSRVTGPWGRVYRMGGDEYLLLVTHFPGTAEAFEAWAHERLPQLFVDGVTASIGIAWRHERPSVGEVLKLADQRMYQAKTAQARAPKEAP